MSGFTLVEAKGVKYLEISEFKKTGNVRACITSRIGGISEGGYSSLNLGFKSGESLKKVCENLHLFSNATGIRCEDMVFSDQVHGNVCREVSAKDRGKGALRESNITGIDALITCQPNVALCIFTADCVPVFLYDKINHAVALCHAGWRGVVGQIVNKTIKEMTLKYNTIPGNLIAAIGPSIGPCCFKVKDDVSGAFKEAFINVADDLIVQKKDSISIDLQKAVSIQLELSGVPESSIIDSGLCSSCQRELFYSYRRDGAETGRMLSVIQLVEEVRHG